MDYWGDKGYVAPPPLKLLGGAAPPPPAPPPPPLFLRLWGKIVKSARNELFVTLTGQSYP